MYTTLWEQREVQLNPEEMLHCYCCCMITLAMVSFITEDYIQMKFISECGFVFNGAVQNNGLHACHWKIMVRSHFITTWTRHLCNKNFIQTVCQIVTVWLIEMFSCHLNILDFVAVLTDGGLQNGPGQHKNSQGL